MAWRKHRRVSSSFRLTRRERQRRSLRLGFACPRGRALCVTIREGAATRAGAAGNRYRSTGRKRQRFAASLQDGRGDGLRSSMVVCERVWGRAGALDKPTGTPRKSARPHETPSRMMASRSRPACSARVLVCDTCGGERQARRMPRQRGVYPIRVCIATYSVPLLPSLIRFDWLDWASGSGRGRMA